MTDDSAAPKRMSSASSPTSHETVTSEQNPASAHDEASAHARGDLEMVERVQTCARELVHLLHRMPVSSGKKQTAIRLLVKVIRLVTPNGHRAAAAGASAEPPKTADGNGTVSTGSSNPSTAFKTQNGNRSGDIPKSGSDENKTATHRPDFPRRRVVGL